MKKKKKKKKMLVSFPVSQLGLLRRTRVSNVSNCCRFFTKSDPAAYVSVGLTQWRTEGWVNGGATHEGAPTSTKQKFAG